VPVFEAKICVPSACLDGQSIVGQDRIIDILNPGEVKEFENPPFFSYQQRKVFFEIPMGLKSKLNEFISPVNDVGLVTQMGYFKACGRFFRFNTFHNSPLRNLKKGVKYLGLFCEPTKSFTP